MKNAKKSLWFLLLLLIIVGCGDSNSKKKDSKTEVKSTKQQEKKSTAEEAFDPMTDKGIGPVKEVKLSPEINEKMAKQGEELFNSLCMACHRPLKKFIGPAPVGILERRTPEWVMNMIMNPVEMIHNDPIAKKLLKEANGAPMADQNVTREQARAILEYFRTLKK